MSTKTLDLLCTVDVLICDADLCGMSIPEGQIYYRHARLNADLHPACYQTATVCGEDVSSHAITHRTAVWATAKRALEMPTPLYNIVDTATREVLARDVLPYIAAVICAQSTDRKVHAEFIR